MATKTATEYRYEHFRLSHIQADMRSGPDTPAPDDRLPLLDLRTPDGERILHRDGRRPRRQLPRIVGPQAQRRLIDTRGTILFRSM